MRNFRCQSNLGFCAWLRGRASKAVVVLFLAWMFSGSAAFGQADPGPQPPAEPTPPGVIPALEPLFRARKSVEKFFDQSANVVCTERVTQAVVGKNSKPFYREESLFDYQLQANNESGGLKLVESRDSRKTAFHDPARTLLITNGFASMLLIVHPSYETSYNFEAAGEETVDGVVQAKIRFKAIPGASSPVGLQIRGQTYAVPLEGMLWINPQSGEILKLIASMESSLSDLGLKDMHSEIHYAAIQFHDPEETYWMPISAIIDVETPRQHWRNIHRFTQYRRFRGTIEVELKDKDKP